MGLTTFVRCHVPYDRDRLTNSYLYETFQRCMFTSVTDTPDPVVGLVEFGEWAFPVTQYPNDQYRFNIEQYIRFGWYRDWETDRKSTRLNSSHSAKSRMPSSA